MEQLSQHQKRRELIKLLFQFKYAKETKGDAQKQYKTASQMQIKNSTLEVQIKQFDCKQIQNYPNNNICENIFCRYNPHKKAQFLCCSEYCDNHAIICGQQTCSCNLDHHKCNFASIESFCDQIASKTQQSIPKQIDLYFQVKSVIYEYMVNRLSQERQALMDWQKDMDNNLVLFLYGFKHCKAKACHAPKITRQKIRSNHSRCCFPLQITKRDISKDKQQIIKIICKKIHKKYSQIIEYFDQKVDQLYYHKKYANLNSAEFIFIDSLKNINTCIQNSEHKQVDSDEDLKEMKIITGRAIYIARKYNKKKFQNLDLEKFSINKLRRIWKRYSEKIFRRYVEGKAMNELLCQMKKLQLKIHSFQDLQFQIDKIIQIISQGQECLFSNSILTKKLVLKNLNQEQLFTKLKKYKRKEINEALISKNRGSLARYRDARFDQVCISNDRLQAALNDIETIKELGNLRNVKKLEIKWCIHMKAQFSMEILNTMPHLKQLALLHYCQKFSYNFMKKLCSFKQLTLFYINCNSHSQYYASYYEDEWFFGQQSLEKANLPSIEDLVELSKLPKLKNIEIGLLDDANSAQVIKNMKPLRHLTLGYDWDADGEVNAGLMRQLFEQRALITLSLVGLKVKSKQVEHIIKKNPHLKTIIIRNYNNNENMNDETVECMANLIQLQNLCISSNIAITGKHLSKLDKLMMLQISCCRSVSKKQIKEALTKMQNLQHFDVDKNKWFDDEVVVSVQSCKQLAYLNIYNTSISCEGLKHLQGLTRLNILMCGLNNINGQNLIELTKQTTRFTRLSIWGLNVNDKELLQISANCQALTHLDIRLTKITAETLLKIKQLKVVRSSLDKDSKEKLREAGIKIYHFW